MYAARKIDLHTSFDNTYITLPICEYLVNEQGLSPDDVIAGATRDGYGEREGVCRADLDAV